MRSIYWFVVVFIASFSPLASNRAKGRRMAERSNSRIIPALSLGGWYFLGGWWVRGPLIPLKIALELLVLPGPCGGNGKPREVISFPCRSQRAHIHSPVTKLAVW